MGPLDKQEPKPDFVWGGEDKTSLLFTFLDFWLIPISLAVKKVRL